MQIVGLADVSLGYGYQQLELMVSALASKYSASKAYVVEPDMKFRQQLHEFSGLNIVRLGSRLPPHSEAFHVEYNVQVHRFLETVNPQIVVFVNAAVLPAVLMLRQRPKLGMYYMLEGLSHQISSGGDWYVTLHEMAKHLVDIVVVPERRRAEIDLENLGWLDVPSVEAFNVTNTATVSSTRTLRCRFIYAGTIGAQTCSHYFFNNHLKDFRIDLAGPVYSDEGRVIFDKATAPGNLRYLGILSTQELDRIRANYAYSVVIWAPSDVNQLYASPNKFFEAIASGIPPICAPHPQCVEIIEEFKCGILAEDWSEQAFIKAMIEAQEMFGSTKYAKMVANCHYAARTALNYRAQFAKVERVLDAIDPFKVSGNM